ncbi:MAG: transcriptional regulator [Rhodospirillales bacterium]|nr:transcriptional regulator [Rhodospirillales bacterium]
MKTITVPIVETDTDYEAALLELEKLIDLDPEKNSADGHRLQALILVIGAYEDEHYPIDPPDPIEAVKFRMDQMGYERADLAKILGGNSRVTDFFSHKRGLSLKMVRRLHDEWGIPADILIRETREPV